MHDLTKNMLVRSFIGCHQSFVTKCKFNAHQNMLLSAGTDGFLMMFDIRQNKMVQKILVHPEPLTGLDISHDSTLVATSAYDGYVRLWDMQRATCVKTFTSVAGGTTPVSALQMVGDKILVGNMDG